MQVPEVAPLPLKNKLYCYSAKSRTWDGAERARRVMEAKLEAQLFGTGVAAPGMSAVASVAPGAAPESATPVDLRGWIAMYLDRKAGKRSAGVQATYTRQLGALAQFLENQLGGQAVPADLLRPNIIEKFKATWKTDADTQYKYQQRMVAFFKYLHKEGAIAKEPNLEAVEMDPHKERGERPLVAADYDRLEAAVPVFYAKDAIQAESVLCLIQLMRHSGLAIHDASNLERSELSQDADGTYRVITSRQKTGNPVNNILPRKIAERLMKLPTPDVFFERRGGDAWKNANNWGGDLRKVMKSIGLMHPSYGTHSLRHTFACSLWADGLSWDEIAPKMGHANSKETQKTYADMVPERQARIDNATRATATFILHD